MGQVEFLGQDLNQAPQASMLRFSRLPSLERDTNQPCSAMTARLDSCLLDQVAD